MTDERAYEDRAARVLTAPRTVAIGAALLIAVLTSSSAPFAQTAPITDNTPAGAATRALNRGQYDQVDTLLRSETDARSIVLRARADIARGRYAEAEERLAGPARSAPGSDAALELGLLQLYLGRRQEGLGTLQGVLARSPQGSPRDLMRMGLAAQALGHFQGSNRFQEANTYLRNASGRAPADVEIQATWGTLFLEKYDNANALKSFQDALGIDETYVPAILGVARASLEQNPPAAKAAAGRALEINQSSVPAHLLIAELALDERSRDDARVSIRRALAVNPNSLEARSLEAAIDFLEGRTAEFEAAAAEVLRMNPVYGEIYRVAGDHLARNYRFDEAVELTRRALTIDPESVAAYADLGMHLLRTGDEAGARRALETSFKADPYDVVTFNLLAMLDTVDTFETIEQGDLIVKLAPEEAGVMREHVMPLAQEALEALSERYQFEVTGPILIEMFPRHDDFAVRTIGLPGFIGALGACFGRVVTLDSPRARPPGQFNWATTLWHEMAHVITLQMSNNRLPRWLSEGISTYEERVARPDWGREMEVPFAQALGEGDLLTLRDLNEGFSNPRTISLVYYQSSLAVEHLIETYGEPALWRLLRAYGEGLETEEAFEAAFDTSIDDVQTAFDARLTRDFAPLRAALDTPAIPEAPTVEQMQALANDHPGSFGVQMTLAQVLQTSGDADGAIAALERAVELVPGVPGDQNPHALIAAIAAERGDTARTIQALDALVVVNSNDVESARRLAALVEPLGDAARTAAAYARVAELDPFDVQAQTVVGRHAMQQRDAERALRAFRAVMAAGPADRATAHLDLAEAYVLGGQYGDAKRETLAALEIAPSFERGQDLLLEIVSAGTGDAP